MKLLAVGGDSTNANTGWRSDTIHILENVLDRRLQWLICIFNSNELPLRQLIIDLDGPTGSNNTFTGPLGKKFNSVEDLDYNPSFKVISGGPDIPDIPQVRAPVKDVVKPRVKSTVWFAQPEQILVSLLSSKKRTERRFAVKTILDRLGGCQGLVTPVLKPTGFLSSTGRRRSWRS